MVQAAKDRDAADFAAFLRGGILGTGNALSDSLMWSAVVVVIDVFL